MLRLILTLLTLAIEPPSPIPPGIGHDMFFEMAQEQFVRQAARPNRLEAVLNRSDAMLVRMLGCPRADCREVATELFRFRGHADRRNLYWGTMHGDPQVRRQSQGLLDAMVCPACEGLGICWACGGSGRYPQPHARIWCWEGDQHYSLESPPRLSCRCPRCHGSGQP